VFPRVERGTRGLKLAVMTGALPPLSLNNLLVAPGFSEPCSSVTGRRVDKMIRKSRQLLSAAFLVVWLLTPSSGSGQPDPENDATFKVFFADFQQAVAHKDRARLEHLMTPSFDYFQAQHVAHAVVFQHLDAEGGTQWNNLQQSVQGSPTVVVQDYKRRPARLLPCRATSNLYHCLLAFQQDNTRHWRWKAMVMPHRY
jgi:hypothetical protein